MFRELLSLFKSDTGVARMSDGFDLMLDHTRRLTEDAGVHLFESPPTDAERRELLELDVQVNRLERQIRRQVVAHLATGGGGAPYGLLLMSLVKDVESIGDYARRISGIYAAGGAPLPDGDEVVEILQEIRSGVGSIYRDVKPVFADEDTEHARKLVDRAVEICRVADGLTARIASGSYDTGTTVTLLSAAHFYQRVTAHLLNVLSGVFLPLDQLDQFDEADMEEVEKLAGQDD